MCPSSREIGREPSGPLAAQSTIWGLACVLDAKRKREVLNAMVGSFLDSWDMRCSQHGAASPEKGTIKACALWFSPGISWTTQRRKNSLTLRWGM